MPATGEEREIVHPYHPGSIYHMTKCLGKLFERMHLLPVLTMLRFQHIVVLPMHDLDSSQIT